MACHAFQTCTRKAHLQLDENAAAVRLATSSEVPVAVVAPVETKLLIAHCILLLRPPVYAEASSVNCCSISLVTHRGCLDPGLQVTEERGMCMDPNRKLLTPCQMLNWRRTKGVTGHTGWSLLAPAGAAWQQHWPQTRPSQSPCALLQGLPAAVVTDSAKGTLAEQFSKLEQCSLEAVVAMLSEPLVYTLCESDSSGLSS